MTYQYFCNDPLEKKISYEYSPYLGKTFIDHWIIYRNKFLMNQEIVKINSFSEPKEDFDLDKKKITTIKFIS